VRSIGARSRSVYRWQKTGAKHGSLALKEGITKVLPMKLIRYVIRKIYNACRDGLACIAGLLILAMMLYISAAVVLRHTAYPIEWALEISEYSLVFLTFFATGWVFKRGGHIRIDVLQTLLRAKYHDKYNASVYGIVALLCLAFTVIGIIATLNMYTDNILQVRILTFPKWILIIVVPIGGFFLFVESLRGVYKHLRKKIVLTVDDEPDILAALKDLLDDDYTVHEACSFDEARRKLKETEYDTVILDIMGVEGFKLLKMAVENDYPAIMLTAHAFNLEALRECVESGAVSFLPKDHMPKIGQYVKDALTMTRVGARTKYFQTISRYMESRFGNEWNYDLFRKLYIDDSEKRGR